MNYLFTCWEGGGNIGPAVEAVRRLVARGHRVRFMSDACNRAEAEAAGAVFVSWKRAPSRSDRRPESQTARDWAAATPQEGLLGIIRDIWCGPSLAYAEDVMEEIRRENCDLVVAPEFLFGVMVGCEFLRQKFVTLSANISLWPLPGIPPLGPGLPPARTEQERRLHAEIAAGSQQMFDSGLPALNATRAALGLPPLRHLAEQLEAASAELLATSPSFDFAADSLPPRVRYVGPIISDPQWASGWTSPWPTDDARPLVTVGFSTTFQNHAAVLQRVMDALAPLPVRVLVTLGGAIERGALLASENCVVVESAPHTVVMRESALVVTHGGHGTVMRALVSQVPLLVIPHGRDQNDNAVRVTERGAGLALMPDASVEAIREACTRLLGEPAFREAAGRLGARVAADAAGALLVESLEEMACGVPV